MYINDLSSFFGNMKTLPPSDEGGGFLQGKKTEGESKKAVN